MSVLPQLRAEVVAAAATPHPRRMRRASLTAVVVALAAVALVVAVLDHCSSPHREPAATATPAPGTTTTPPGDQLGGLSLLRRPQTAAERRAITSVREILRPQSQAVLREDYVRAVTLPGSAPGLLYSLVREPVPAKVPANLRGKADYPDPLCFYLRQGEGGASVCWSWADVLAGAALTADTQLLCGLVPDGVATVVIGEPDGTTRRAPVHENVWSLAPAGAATSVEWLDARGRKIGPASRRALPAASPGHR